MWPWSGPLAHLLDCMLASPSRCVCACSVCGSVCVVYVCVVCVAVRSVCVCVCVCVYVVCSVLCVWLCVVCVCVHVVCVAVCVCLVLFSPLSITVDFMSVQKTCVLGKQGYLQSLKLQLQLSWQNFCSKCSDILKYGQILLQCTGYGNLEA